MQALLTTLELVSPMNSTVLITERPAPARSSSRARFTTTARAPASASSRSTPRRSPRPLAEAELFGHVKGAFTGRSRRALGRFELAHRGTLFIDEVASMSLPLQAKLLRALQEREIERVGESRPMRLDIRVIAASNMDSAQDGQGRDLPRRSLLPLERDSR
jgi:DNA-binding NtrC family response regulator